MLRLLLALGSLRDLSILHPHRVYIHVLFEQYLQMIVVSVC